MLSVLIGMTSEETLITVLMMMASSREDSLRRRNIIIHGIEVGRRRPHHDPEALEIESKRKITTISRRRPQTQLMSRKKSKSGLW